MKRYHLKKTLMSYEKAQTPGVELHGSLLCLFLSCPELIDSQVVFVVNNFLNKSVFKVNKF